MIIVKDKNGKQGKHGYDGSSGDGAYEGVYALEMTASSPSVKNKDDADLSTVDRETGTNDYDHHQLY